MATAALCYAPAIPSYTQPPKVDIRFRLLREGEVTTGVKFLRLYRNFESLGDLAMVYWAEEGSGEFTQTCRIDLATLLAQGEWEVIGRDNAAPRKVRMVYLALSGAGTYTFNITSSEVAGVDGYTLRSGDRLLVIDAAGAVVGLTPTP